MKGRQIHDLDRTDAATALFSFETAVRALLEELGADGEGGR